MNKLFTVIYARVSTKEQEREGYSIPAQLKFLREYAESNNMEILKEFTDSETGAKSGRTNFMKMVKFLSKEHSTNQICRTILVEKTDRLYRNFKDYILLDDLDLEIHLVKENQILSKDSKSNDKFFHGIKVLMAKSYIDNLSEEVKKGMLEKAEQGMYPSKAPFGYKNVRINNKRVIVPDPENAPVIKEMFRMYASGAHSFSDIADYLQKKGIRLRKSSAKVNTSAIHKILHSSFYIGQFTWANKTYIGSYEPIIPIQLFKETQRMLLNRGRESSRKNKRTFLFQGFIKCEICGRMMVPDLKKNKYVYYHCKGGCSKKEECTNNRYVREEVFDELFTKALNNLVFEDSIFKILINALKENHAEEIKFHQTRQKELQSKQLKLDRRLSQLYEDKLDGIISYELYKQKRDEYTTMKAEVNASINEGEKANTNYLNQGVQLVELLSSAAQLYVLGNITQKRKIINLIGSNYFYVDNKLGIEYRQPFDVIANINPPKTEISDANLQISDAYKLWWAQEESNL